MPQRGFPGDDDEQLFPARPGEIFPRGGHRGFPAEQPDPLEQTFGAALKRQPDQAGRIFNLRLKTGLPPALIERNLEAVEREAARQDFDADRFRRDSPLLAAWLAENPELAAIAQDDLEPLSGIERALQIGTRSVRALTTGPMRLSGGVWGAVRAGAEWTGADDLAEFARGSAAVAEHLRTRLAGDRAGAGGFESSVYGGLESLSLTATALPAAALGGAPALIAVLGGVTAGEAYSQAREEGRGIGRATAFALGQGAIEAATEFIPARWFLADLAKNAGFWRALKHQALAEIPGEQIATALQDLNEWALVREDGTFVDYLRERPSAAGETLVATIVAVGGQAALVRGLERVGGKPAPAQVLEELHAAAEASKTRERAPEALRAFVERISAAGLTHVYAPAGAFTEYFQKQGEDPEQLAAELTGNPDALRLARATDGDLAIPTSAYVSRIVGSGHESFFVNELRLSPDSMNARETQEAIAAEASAAPREEPADPSAPARAQIYEAMVEKLTATNRYTPQEVDAQARLYESVFGALASRSRVDPLELFQRFTPAVVAEGRPSDASIEIDTGTGPGGIPESPARAGETPQQRELRRAGHLEALTAVLTREAQLLDPHVDDATIRADLDRRLALREEQQQAAAESGTGQDLLRAIADYGGVWWEKNTGAFKGEIEFYAKENRDVRSVTRGGRVRHQPGRATWRGVPGVFAEEGLTPDGMVEALRQDQRFEYIADINGLLDAIDKAMQSDPDVDALPGTAELGELGIVPGTRWWAEGDEVFADDQRYGPLEQPAPAPNERGETAYFIGWQESGPDDVAAIALYNVIGGERSGTTLSADELVAQGIPHFDPPELAGEAGDVSFDPTEFEQAAPRDARRAWLERRIVEARSQGREDFEANRLLQDLLDEEADEIVRARESIEVVDELAPAQEAPTGEDVDALSARLRDRLAGLPQGRRGRTEFEQRPIEEELQRDVALPESVPIVSVMATVTRDLEPPALRRRAFAFAKAASTHDVVNTHTGWTLKLSKDGLKKSANYALRAEQLVALEHIDALLEQATYLRSDTDRRGRNVTYDYLYTPFEYDGALYVAKMAVRTGPRGEGRSFYTLHAQRVERPAGVNVDYTSTVPAATLPEGPGRSSLSTQVLLQLVNQARGTTPLFQEGPGAQTKGTFNPTTRTIRLLKHANRSTFIHESAHLFLEVLSDLAAAPGANPRLVADMQTLLESFTFEGDLAAWRGLSNEQRRDHHEEFARGFEKYLGEGKAPTPELQSLFARFRAWFLGVYRTLRRLNVELSPEVRAVMDRLVATDEAIAAAEADAGIVALFTDAAAAGVPEAEFEGYREQLAAASEQARARLQARLIRELEREQEAWWQEQRAAVREEVAVEFYARPVYRAIAAMRGTLPDGSPLPEGTPATPLSKDFLVAQFGRSILRKLPRPFLYSADSGLPPDTVAQIFGFADGEGLVGAILAAPPLEEAIDAATDERMLERHGDLLRDPERLADEAREAIAGEHRETVIRAELGMLRKLRAAAAPSVRGATTEQRAEDRAGQRAGAARLRTEMPDQVTLARLAKGQIAGMRLRDIRPDRFFATARRHSRTATQAAAQQKFEEAVAAKQQELVNLALYREAVAAREAVDTAREAFAKMFTPDGPLAKRRNMDYVHAARAIAATYFWPERRMESATEALELVRKHDPELHAMLAEHVRAALAAGRDLASLTFEAFSVMRESVDALWEQSLREQQMLVDGKLVDRNEALAALEYRFDELGTPQRQEPQTKKSMGLLGIRAGLRRMEHWVDLLDGGDPNGPFRRYLWTPVSEAAQRYRVQKAEYLKKYLDLVKAIETTLVPGTIAAPELNYTFESRAALLHALLHTGNESNFQKLLRGYQWGALMADGTVDASRWRAFLQRMHREGVLTKADWDYVQSVWDLVGELKPHAQKVHRDMYGHYFSEITAWPVETPFGTYAGGYVPAIVDPLQEAEAGVKNEKSLLTEGADNAFMFPTTGRGFTRSRIEAYARPLALDLRLVPQHLDKVLRFIHLEPRVKDVGRLVLTHRFGDRLNAYDPAAKSDLLMPWLQRAASQRVSKASQGHAGRALDAVFRALRTRTGLNLMAANVINTLEQFTGLFPAALKVKPRYLRNALWRYVRGHNDFMEAIHADEWMQTRVTAAAIETQRTIEDLLLNPSKYEKLRDFGQRHGYFMQLATQSLVDKVVYAGAFEEGMEEHGDEVLARRTARAAVRQTQGSFAPEDVSRVEAQTPVIRALVMFFGYFNMLANLNATELEKVARDMGLRKGAGRALYIYTLGFMMPAVLSEVIRQSLGGWESDDDEFWIDEAMWLFFGSQGRVLSAMVPGVGAAANYAIGKFSGTRYGDRISVSPAISVLEGAGRAPISVYKAIAEEGRARTAVRDTLDAVALLTGLPVGAIKRPAGYLADVVEGREEPEDVVDLTRGLVSGRSQVEQ